MVLVGWGIILLASGCSASAVTTTPLPSWKEGPARTAILDIVAAATDESSPSYVAKGERVATFDNDGTLWVEHPLYTQAVFALDRVRALAPQHPEWKSEEPFRAILADDETAIAGFHTEDWVKIIAATHTGMSTARFEEIATDWFTTERDERFGRPYTQLVYQPMLEVLRYLRAHGFQTFIVSGGGQEFIRVISDDVYGISTSQVVGSSVVTKFESEDGTPVLMREPKVFFIDDHAGKPIGINLFIGKRPVAAFGNSGGDKEMLEWTTAGTGRRLGMLVLHDDPVREYAYGPAEGLPDTHVGRFSQELYDDARKKGWVVISMKNDWNRIFPWEE